MGGMRVMVANSPVSYREVISAVLKEMRPQLEVLAVEPDDLDEEFARFSPHLVVCSQATELIQREAAAWVELYPGHASEVVVVLCGERVTYPEGMDFEALLSMVDEAARQYENV